MRAPSKSILLSGILGIFAPWATGAPGDVDSTFPVLTVAGGVGGAGEEDLAPEIHAVVPQPDGKLVVAGNFGSLGGVARKFAARLNPDNASLPFLDSYQPDPNSQVRSVTILPTGGSIFAGNFNSMNVTAPSLGVVRYYLSKLDNDGKAVVGFVPTAISNTYSVAAHPDGFIVGTQTGLYLLDHAGKKAAPFTDFEAPLHFNAYNNGIVTSVLVQPNSKILLGGPYIDDSDPVVDETPETPPDPLPVRKKYLNQVGPYGNFDTFNPPEFSQKIQAIARLKDGKILVAGNFEKVTTVTVVPRDPPTNPPTTVEIRTEVPQKCIARLNADGTHDTSFKPVISNGLTSSPAVRCMAVQADGKILIGGNFTQISSTSNTTPPVTTTHNIKGIARLNSDGSVDTSFNVKINSAAYQVNSITILENGKIMITGTFGSFEKPNGTSDLRPKIARLSNDVAFSELRTPNSQTIRWMRGGSAPEVSSVSFEYSDDGTTWLPLTGTVSRITGGWQILHGMTLNSSHQLRALGTTTGGKFNGSTGVVAKTSEYPIPQLAVAPPTGGNLEHGGVATVAPVAVGTSRDYQFQAKNIGTGQFFTPSASISGTHASLFTLVSQPSGTLTGPTGSSAFTVRFAPTTAGAKTATLTLNAYDHNVALKTITITLNGSGVTAIEDWRYQYFSTIANTGNAADSADPDGDGHTNQFEFVAGLIPNNRTSRFEHRVDASSGNTKIIFSPVVAGRTYEVLSNMDMGSTWNPATVGAPSDNGTERTLTETISPDPKRFYRVRITKP